MRGDRRIFDRRGQSNPLAVALILAIVLVTTVVVVGVGTLALEEGQSYTESQRGEHAVSKLDAQASAVALDGAGSQTVALAPNGEANVEVRETGWMRLELVDETGNTTLVNRTLGTVTHRSGEQRVAYQAGGVWRKRADANASVMVSPPEFHYNGQTLTLPLVTVRGEEYDLSTADLRDGRRIPVYPNASAGRANPVPEGVDLVVTVKSDYYRGWHSFFDRRVGGEVYYPNNTSSAAAVRFRSAESGAGVLATGLVSVGTSDRVTMQGSGNKPTYIDSYDSSIDPYPASATDNGTVNITTGLDLSGNSYINGTVDTNGSVGLDGSETRIYGDLWHQGVSHPSRVTGNESDNGSAISISPIDPLVENRTDEVSEDNNNSQMSCLDDGDADDCDEFDAGRYYVSEDMEVKPGDTVVFDLQDGNVTLVLDGHLDIQGKIEVDNASGNNRVKVWLPGGRVDMNNGEVTVPGDESLRFQILGPSNTKFDMQKAEFVGVYYAPSSPGPNGFLKMQNSQVYGAAVTGKVDMNSGSAVHHDKALVGKRIVPENVTTAAELNYLHVSVNEVHVDGAG